MVRLPRRILEDEELHALSAQGSKAVLTQVPRPIPALSYASEKFFEETALYYDALCPILARHKHPNGGLVAAQVDNEMVYFFHNNAYAADFSPASIRGYRAFLREKYGGVEALGEAHGRDYADFEQAEPPRSFEGRKKEDIPFHVDWAEYRKRHLVEALSRLAGMLKTRGLDGMPLFHNYPHPLGAVDLDSTFMTPQNLPALEEELDFAGFDIYFRKEMYDYIKTVVSYVVSSSRYPYVPELFTGTWPGFVNPGGPEDEEFVAKAALMQGVKGFSRYVLVERDRWMASPIRRDAGVREDKYDMYHRVNEMAEKRRFTDLRRQAGVLLLGNREYDRLQAASALLSYPGDFLETPTTFPGYPSAMTVSESPLGFEEPIQLAKSEWFTKCYRGLMQAGYGFLLSDTALSPERWQDYEAVVLASFEYMNAPLQRALVEYAEAGGTVVLGPQTPRLDATMRPDDTLSSALRATQPRPLTVGGARIGESHPVGRGWISHLTDLSNPSQALEAALQSLDAIRPVTSDARLRLGASYEGVEAAATRFVAPETTVVFGIFEDNALWASLVLGFDSEKRVSFITTVDPSELDAGGGFEAAAKELAGWVNEKHSPCSLGLFTDLDGAGAFLNSWDKAATLRELAREDRLIADPLPEPLAKVLGTS